KLLDKFEPDRGTGEAKREKSVYLITDCQAYGWHENDKLDSKRLISIMDKLQYSNTELVIIDVGENDTSNFAVTSLKSASPLVGTGVPVRFDAVLTNMSTRDLGEIVVTFFVDEQEQQSITAAVPPGEPKTVSFMHEFRDKGYHSVQIASKTDPLGIDNNRYLSLKVREKVKVLIIDGQPSPESWQSETAFLETALKVGAGSLTDEKLSVIDPKSIMQGELEQMVRDASRGRLEDYDVIFLCNVSDFSHDTAKELEKYIEMGGSLVIFLGEMVVPERYNEIIYNNGEGLFPVKLIEWTGDKDKMTSYPIDIVEFSHPAVKFFEPESHRSLLATPRTFVYYKVELPQGKKDISVLAIYKDADRSPAVIEKRFGRGHVILITTTSSIEWNTWAVRPFFLCFLNEIVSYLTPGAEAKLNILVGEPFHKIVPSKEFSQEVHLVLPGGESIKKALSPLGEGNGKEQEFLFLHNETNKSGIYKIVFTQDIASGSISERTETFTVNVDICESDMEKIVQSELNTAFPKIKPEIKLSKEVLKELSGDKENGKGGGEIWWYLITAVFCLMLLETVLAQYFGKYEK
ncbi:MAG: hypothetical protein ABIH42_03420, partial [Planctomycetota bacterium]